MDFILMLNNTIRATGTFDVIANLNVDLVEIGLLNFNMTALEQTDVDEQPDFEQGTWFLEATFDTPNVESSQVFLEALTKLYEELQDLVYTYKSNDDKIYKEYVFNNGQLV